MQFIPDYRNQHETSAAAADAFEANGRAALRADRFDQPVQAAAFREAQRDDVQQFNALNRDGK